jgi:hypothetical protein
VSSVLQVQNLFGGLSPACDFMDLVQNGFYTRPVAHQGHDLALARPPLQGSFERRSCTSITVSRHRIHPPNRFSNLQVDVSPIRSSGHDDVVELEHFTSSPFYDHHALWKLLPATPSRAKERTAVTPDTG